LTMEACGDTVRRLFGLRPEMGLRAASGDVASRDGTEGQDNVRWQSGPGERME
jgi:hypothetical protein